MEHFIEIIAELLFGSAKNKPDKMPENISYTPCFTVRHPVKKTLARMVATAIVIGAFSLLWLFAENDTQILAIVFIILFGILLMLSLLAFSFRCYVTEQHIKKSYGGMFGKHIDWDTVSCVRVVEQTNEKSVVIALYNEEGNCVIDLNTDMDNVWYVVKMAETKTIPVKQEKDLSLKQISHL